MEQLRAGQKIDRYELVHPIARGGMGTVWLAVVRRSNGFERLFALKTVLPDLATDPSFRAMFMDEARVASAVRHPGIGAILDVGEEAGALYLVMEWVDGCSLHALMESARVTGEDVPVAVSLKIMAEVCEALHATHEAVSATAGPLGIVHRDISPHNILIDTSGHAKLIDFGIAMVADRLSERTASGSIKGKVKYMAPEQACGRAVDRRADIWGMGATLHYLVAGTPPYGKAQETTVLGKLISNIAPPPVGREVPAEVRAVIAKCLSIAPSDRYQTARELGTAIEEASRALGVQLAASDLAIFVETRLADKTGRRRDAVAEALRQLRARSPAESSSSVAGSSTSGSSTSGSSTSGSSEGRLDSVPDETLGASMLRNAGLGEPKSPDRGRLAWVSGAVMVFVLMGLVFEWGARGIRGPSAGAGPTHSATLTVPPSQPSAGERAHTETSVAPVPIDGGASPAVTAPRASSGRARSVFPPRTPKAVGSSSKLVVDSERN